jgi:hypothetical protein
MGGGSSRDAVTICTVVTPLHKQLAAINHRLVETLNPGGAARWIVAEVPELSFPPTRIATLFLRTHPVGRQFAIDWQADYLEMLKARHFELDTIAALIPRATVIPGPTIAQTVSQVAAHYELGEAEAERRLTDNIGSYQHAGGLKAALSEVRTRYAVVMDPDLYVVRPGWIGEIIGHMSAKGLSVFGVPWHPRWYEKQRRFPAPHLMVIDLERTGPVAELMDPGLRAPGDRFVSGIWQAFIKQARTDPKRARRDLLRRLGAAIGEDLRQRRTIGRARDTGYAMAAAVAAAGGRVETVTPVFRPETEFFPDSVSSLQAGRLEALLPEAWRYRPRRRGSASRSGFREAGYPDVGARVWEEFMWDGAPFAFHLRGDPQRRVSWRVDHDGLLSDLNAILEAQGRRPLAAPRARVLGLPSADARRARLLALLLNGEFAEDEVAAILPLDDAPELREVLRTAANQALYGCPDEADYVEFAHLMQTLAAAPADAVLPTRH